MCSQDSPAIKRSITAQLLKTRKRVSSSTMAHSFIHQERNRNDNNYYYARSPDDYYSGDGCSYEIIKTTDIERCREVMHTIMKGGHPVAIDAEGVNLGATGRMTLFQMCTWHGHVYLLDLIDERCPNSREGAQKLLRYGLVKTMLESPVNVKVGVNT